MSAAVALLIGAGLVGADPCAGARDLTSAVAALDRGELARADYLSSLALSLSPDCPEALVVQGRVLTLKGRLREAREALEKAVRLAPTDAEARYQLAVWLYRRQLHADAVPQLEKVIALRPRDARALGYLALSLEGLGEPERAELAYRAALKVNGRPFRDPFLDYYYGRFLLKQNRLEESRARWAQVKQTQAYGQFPVPEDWIVEVRPQAFGLDPRQEQTVEVAIEPRDPAFKGTRTFNVHVFTSEQREQRWLLGGVTLDVTKE